MLPDVLPARNSEVDVADFEVEIVVYDPRVNVVHLLTHTVALVFDSCDGTTKSTALIDEFVGAGVGAHDHVTGLVEAALDDLNLLGLLEGTQPIAPPPCLGCAEAVVPSRLRRLLRAS